MDRAIARRMAAEQVALGAASSMAKMVAGEAMALKHQAALVSVLQAVVAVQAARV